MSALTDRLYRTWMAQNGLQGAPRCRGGYGGRGPHAAKRSGIGGPVRTSADPVGSALDAGSHFCEQRAVSARPERPVFFSPELKNLQSNQ